MRISFPDFFRFINFSEYITTEKEWNKNMAFCDYHPLLFFRAAQLPNQGFQPKQDGEKKYVKSRAFEQESGDGTCNGKPRIKRKCCPCFIFSKCKAKHDHGWEKRQAK